MMRYFFRGVEPHGGTEVRAFSFDDGEELQVFELSVNDGWIIFTTYCESTGFSARHRWRFTPGGYAIHEYTLNDVWIRAQDSEVGSVLKNKVNKRGRSKGKRKRLKLR